MERITLEIVHRQRSRRVQVRASWRDQETFNSWTSPLVPVDLGSSVSLEDVDAARLMQAVVKALGELPQPLPF